MMYTAYHDMCSMQQLWAHMGNKQSSLLTLKLRGYAFYETSCVSRIRLYSHLLTPVVIKVLDCIQCYNHCKGPELSYKHRLTMLLLQYLLQILVHIFLIRLQALSGHPIAFGLPNSEGHIPYIENVWLQNQELLHCMQFKTRVKCFSTISILLNNNKLALVLSPSISKQVR